MDCAGKMACEEKCEMDRCKRCCCCGEIFLRVIDKILDYKGCGHRECDHGHISLAAGTHEVFVRTKCQPDQVFVSGKSCHQVCGANVDMYAVDVVPGGFRLIADVKNDSLKIDWLAFCDKKDC